MDFNYKFNSIINFLHIFAKKHTRTLLKNKQKVLNNNINNN